MKVKKYWILIVLVMFACEKEVAPEISLLGEWNFSYRILDDGTKTYDDPYALVEFEYSDAFILEEEGMGKTKWFGEENGTFSWEEQDESIRMSIPGPTELDLEFEFLIGELSQDSMNFSTPKGFQYRLVRKQ